MITRRALLMAAGADAMSHSLTLFAQPSSKIPRIGYLALRGGNNLSGAFMQGMAEFGYVDGKNLVIERRFADADPGRLPALAAELVRLDLKVLVALDPPSFEASMQTTRTIPIVIRSSGDPVAEGIVASLAHPGGNVTGVYSLYAELNGKRLELLKETLPSVSRVMLLWNSKRRAEEERLKIAVEAARKLGLNPLPAAVNKSEDFEGAFKNAARENANSLLVLRSPLMVNNTARITRLALNARLPAVYDEAAYVEAGGLMSYGASLHDIYYRAAYFVDKILKGANPGDIPMEQPTKLELVINLKTAKAFGVRIPQSVLVQATKVIE